MRRGLFAIVVGAAVVGGLTACGAAGDQAATPTANSTPASTFVPVVDGTVAATGTFTGDGGVTGTVTIVRDADRYRIELHDVTPPRAPHYNLQLRSEDPAASGGCGEANWTYDLGSYESSDVFQTGTRLLYDDSPAEAVFADPTYVDGVQIVVANPDSKASNEACRQLIAGYAKLTWALPDLRPDIHPVDSGPRPGAEGEVKIGPTGIPSQYWIAVDDRYADVAARFGLTTADLDYLNPVNPHDPNTIPYGCTINVSKQARGATERCLWRP